MTICTAARTRTTICAGGRSASRSGRAWDARCSSTSTTTAMGTPSATRCDSRSSSVLRPHLRQPRFTNEPGCDWTLSPAAFHLANAALFEIADSLALERTGDDQPRTAAIPGLRRRNRSFQPERRRRGEPFAQAIGARLSAAECAGARAVLIGRRWALSPEENQAAAGRNPLLLLRDAPRPGEVCRSIAIGPVREMIDMCAQVGATATGPSLPGKPLFAAGTIAQPQGTARIGQPRL